MEHPQPLWTLSQSCIILLVKNCPCYAQVRFSLLHVVLITSMFIFLCTSKKSVVLLYNLSTGGRRLLLDLPLPQSSSSVG